MGNLTVADVLGKRQDDVDDRHRDDTGKITELRHLFNKGELEFAVVEWENHTTGDPFCGLCRGRINHHCCAVGIANDRENGERPLCDKCARDLAPTGLLGSAITQRQVIREQESVRFQEQEKLSLSELTGITPKTKKQDSTTLDKIHEIVHFGIQRMDDKPAIGASDITRIMSQTLEQVAEVLSTTEDKPF